MAAGNPDQAGSCLMERLDVILDCSARRWNPRRHRTDDGDISLHCRGAGAAVGARLLEACRTRWPNVTLTVREGSSASLEEWVLDRRIDIALLQDLRQSTSSMSNRF